MSETSWPRSKSVINFSSRLNRITGRLTNYDVIVKIFDLLRQLEKSTISTIEKQIAAKDERINDLHDELRNMESDLDESYLQKLKGLRQTEQKFKQFLESYPQYKGGFLTIFSMTSFCSIFYYGLFTSFSVFRLFMT